MTSLTLSADEHLIDQARAYAQARGTTLDQLVQDYLQQLAGGTSPSQAADEFARLASLRPVQSEAGWRFNREEIHRRGSAS